MGLLIVPPARQTVRGTVKWYDPQQGFGFVMIGRGASEDAFLPASALPVYGMPIPAEGDTVLCDVVRGPRGPKVAALHAVEVSPGE